MVRDRTTASLIDEIRLSVLEIARGHRLESVKVHVWSDGSVRIEVTKPNGTSAAATSMCKEKRWWLEWGSASVIEAAIGRRVRVAKETSK